MVEALFALALLVGTLVAVGAFFIGLAWALTKVLK